MKKLMPLLVAMGIIACNNSETTKTNQATAKMVHNEYKKADWINTTNVYEVNVRQYTKEGTFNAFAKELPRLKEMGVETLWFMPITPIAQKNMKGSLGSYYACSDYTSINPEFGNLEDFKNLVKEAHSMGFKVIIDWVANHTGWDHVWTKIHPEYYLKDSATNDFKIASGMDDIIELDYKNPALRKAMIDAMRYWITECDIDGYRCDLAFWVELDFWLEARTELEKTKTLFWLAESDPLEHPDYFKAFDACYTWTWMHKTEDFYKKNQDKNILDTVIRQYDEVCNTTDIPLWFTTNHDENTWNGTEYEKYGDMAKALAVFSFTWNGMPMIYSGQELPNMKRLKFFDKDPIEWNGKYELHDFYKTLLTLKKNNPALRAGDPGVTTHLLYTTADKNVLAFIRKNGNNEVLVLINFSNAKTQFGVIEVKDIFMTGHYTDVFTKQDKDLTTDKQFDLLPWQYLVFEKK
ncbi:alpha-amylase family glycosyl hydrolase [Ferruginibacter sp. SUN106]|uniref:alpha-amylase family glycosyl hydrolase n=1 Tax=Ferruginibacter sp. SUN106 TaxID=2978348 RepID=UPI003D35C594